MLAIHLAVSIFIVLALFHEDLDLRKLLFLLVFGLLPDIDTFFFIHRATFHSLIVPVGLIVGYGVAARYKAILREHWYTVLVAVLLVLVHIALDMMSNGVFLFYPVSHVSVHPVVDFYVTSSGFGSHVETVLVGTTDSVTYIARPSQSSTGRMPIVENGVQLVMLLVALLMASVRIRQNYLATAIDRARQAEVDIEQP